MATTVEAEATNRETRNSELIAALHEPPAEGVASRFEFDVINDSERGRWVATLGEEAIGELSYRFVGGRTVLLTTCVEYRDLIDAVHPGSGAFPPHRDDDTGDAEQQLRALEQDLGRL